MIPPPLSQAVDHMIQTERDVAIRKITAVAEKLQADLRALAPAFTDKSRIVGATISNAFVAVPKVEIVGSLRNGIDSLTKPEHVDTGTFVPTNVSLHVTAPQRVRAVLMLVIDDEPKAGE